MSGGRKRYHRQRSFSLREDDLIEEEQQTKSLEDEHFHPNPFTSSYDVSRRRPILGVEGEEFFPMSSFTQERGMVHVKRPVYSDRKFGKRFEEAPTDLNKRFIDTIFFPRIRCPPLKEIFFNVFPIAKTLVGYHWRRDILIDLLTGMTTGITRIPQSMAYAFLVHLKPAAGLYTAFITALFYVIFGGSNHLAVGAQGVVSLMVGSAVSRQLKSSVDMRLEGNFTLTNGTTLDQTAVQTVVALTFMAGIIQIGLGVFRLGFITNYLSDPLIGGFTTGAACQVVVSQLGDIFGLEDISASGLYNVIETIVQVFEKLGEVNVATFLISLYCLTLLLIIKYLNTRLQLRVPVPGELIVMISMMIFSSLTNAEEQWKVKVVGDIPAGFQTPELPKRSVIPSVIDVSFTSAIVSFAIGYSIAKRLALKHDYEISGNQEVFAFGVMNCASSFFHGFVATSSMSVSALHDSLGGVSQLANVVAAFIVLLVILFLGFLFAPVPDCVLSCIILVNLKSILMQFADLGVLWRVSKIDFLLWIVTWAAVVILDVDIGLLIGVAFSLFTIVFRTQWPYVCELGRIPSTDLYKNRSLTPEALIIEGIRIVRFEGSLYFASAEHFRKSLYKQTGCNPYKIVHGRQTFASKIQQLRTALQDVGEGQSSQESPNESSPLVGNSAPFRKEVHHIIVDFSTCAFIDSVGLRTLNQCIAEYREAGISVYLANVRAAVRAILFNDAARSGVSSRKTFLSVHDAVLAALESAQRVEERDYLLMDAMNRSGMLHNVTRMPSEVERSD